MDARREDDLDGDLEMLEISAEEFQRGNNGRTAPGEEVEPAVPPKTKKRKAATRPSMQRDTEADCIARNERRKKRELTKHIKTTRKRAPQTQTRHANLQPTVESIPEAAPSPTGGKYHPTQPLTHLDILTTSEPDSEPEDPLDNLPILEATRLFLARLAAQKVADKFDLDFSREAHRLALATRPANAPDRGIRTLDSGVYVNPDTLIIPYWLTRDTYYETENPFLETFRQGEEERARREISEARRRWQALKKVCDCESGGQNCKRLRTVWEWVRNTQGEDAMVELMKAMF